MAGGADTTSPPEEVASEYTHADPISESTRAHL